jgi:hypothetical protein
MSQRRAISNSFNPFYSVASRSTTPLSRALFVTELPSGGRQKKSRRWQAPGKPFCKELALNDGSAFVREQRYAQGRFLGAALLGAGAFGALGLLAGRGGGGLVTGLGFTREYGRSEDKYGNGYGQN